MTNDSAFLAALDRIPLTRGQKHVLQRLTEDEDAELLWACPGGWFIDTEKVDGRIGFALLRKALITKTYGTIGEYATYRISERGMAALHKAKETT